jgi:molybdopterin-containing oxidoreductase family iron-sulfur binding subunit
VREVGVKEKSTFCIQRINEEKIEAKAAGQPLQDGAIQPACVQSCTANALVFGDLNNPESAVSRLARSPRGSKLLEELGTQPKVTYLARDAWHDSSNQ